MKRSEKNRIALLIMRIRKTLQEFSDIPEKTLYQTLVEEADGWKMRLEELEDDAK